MCIVAEVSCVREGERSKGISTKQIISKKEVMRKDDDDN